MKSFKSKTLCFCLLLQLALPLQAITHEQEIIRQRASRGLFGLMLATIMIQLKWSWQYYLPLIILATPEGSRLFLSTRPTLFRD